MIFRHRLFVLIYHNEAMSCSEDPFLVYDGSTTGGLPLVILVSRVTLSQSYQPRKTSFPCDCASDNSLELLQNKITRWFVSFNFGLLEESKIHSRFILEIGSGGCHSFLIDPPYWPLPERVAKYLVDRSLLVGPSRLVLPRRRGESVPMHDWIETPHWQIDAHNRKHYLPSFLVSKMFELYFYL